MVDAEDGAYVDPWDVGVAVVLPGEVDGLGLALSALVNHLGSTGKIMSRASSLKRVSAT